MSVDGGLDGGLDAIGGSPGAFSGSVCALGGVSIDF
jgi:hypothetical protein